MYTKYLYKRYAVKRTSDESYKAVFDILSNNGVFHIRFSYIISGIFTNPCLCCDVQGWNTEQGLSNQGYTIITDKEFLGEESANDYNLRNLKNIKK